MQTNTENQNYKNQTVPQNDEASIRSYLLGRGSFASRSVLPPAKVVTVSAAGHFLLYDNYLMVADSIWKFIAGVTGVTP